MKKQYDIDVDKKKVLLKETIKNIGRFSVDIKFGNGVMARLALHIQPE